MVGITNMRDLFYSSSTSRICYSENSSPDDDIRDLAQLDVYVLFLQIADFGLSNLYSGDEYLQTFCGSPLYASPEIVNGRPYHGPEVDTWSLGVLLYTMVHGTMPFDGNNHKTLVQQISTGNYRKPNNPSG